jgi:hypothetical protein
MQEVKIIVQRCPKSETQDQQGEFRRIQGIKMSTTITAVTPLVSLLEGSSNYESWARDVKMLLIGEDLWDHVDMEPATDAAASVKKAAQKDMAKMYMCSIMSINSTFL